MFPVLALKRQVCLLEVVTPSVRRFWPQHMKGRFDFAGRILQYQIKIGERNRFRKRVRYARQRVMQDYVKYSKAFRGSIRHDNHLRSRPVECSGPVVLVYRYTLVK